MRAKFPALFILHKGIVLYICIHIYHAHIVTASRKKHIGISDSRKGQDRTSFKQGSFFWGVCELIFIVGFMAILYHLATTFFNNLK